MHRTHNVLESQPNSEQMYCLQALSSSQLHLGTLVLYKEISIPTGKKKKCFQLFSATAASLSFHANVLVLWLSGWCLHTRKQPLTRVCIPKLFGKCPKAAIPISPGSLSCSRDDAGLPNKKEKNNLLEHPGNFSHTSELILNIPSFFHLTQKICRASLYLIALLILVMGLSWQLVKKQFYSVGESSFWLRELFTDLCSNSKSDIPLSQKGQQSEETEINGKTWSLQLLGRLEGVSFKEVYSLLHLCSHCQR